jgi:hypothetical protein
MDNEKKEMSWDEKRLMCGHLNSSEYSKAVSIFIKNINNIDNQAIEMFVAGMLLTEDVIKPDLESHVIIENAIKEYKSESFFSAIGLARYDELVNRLDLEKFRGHGA